MARVRVKYVSVLPSSVHTLVFLLPTPLARRLVHESPLLLPLSHQPHPNTKPPRNADITGYEVVYEDERNKQCSHMLRADSMSTGTHDPPLYPDEFRCVVSGLPSGSLLYQLSVRARNSAGWQPEGQTRNLRNKSCRAVYSIQTSADFDNAVTREHVVNNKKLDDGSVEGQHDGLLRVNTFCNMREAVCQFPSKLIQILCLRDCLQKDTLVEAVLARVSWKARRTRVGMNTDTYNDYAETVSFQKAVF